MLINLLSILSQDGKEQELQIAFESDYEPDPFLHNSESWTQWSQETPGAGGID